MKICNNINSIMRHSQYSYHGSPIPANKALQNTYKNQLDSLVQQRNRMKIQQKQKEDRQKKEYNQRIHMGQQAQKMKQASYRNYYNMLINNQKHVQDNYISPFAYRDTLKDQHINYGIQQNSRKMTQLQDYRKRMENQKRNHYRHDLMQQMQDKKSKQTNQKTQKLRNQQQYRKYARLPQQLRAFQRERKWEEMNKYKQDLDKVRQNKQSFHRQRVNTMDNKSNTQMPQDLHNPLINPLPYNIQNPYILKQISKQQGRGFY